MKVKTKISWTLLGMALLVALVGSISVHQQYVAAAKAAIKEAENVARAMGFFLSTSTGLSASAQEAIMRLNEVERRDVVLVDPNQTILADAVASEIGKKFKEDLGDEVGATLKDRRPRTFIENSSDSPLPIKQIVVPVQDQLGHVIGAVILEYTPLYDEFMEATRTSTREIIFASCGSVLAALLIAVFIGRAIATPLQQLTTAATKFASGNTNVPMPPSRDDEIGELTDAFDNMVQRRRHAEEELRHARDDLEVRVTERTADLAKTNQALETENAERKRAESELRTKTAFLEAQINSSLDGILVVDEFGKTALQNKRLVNLVKLPASAEEGKSSQTGLPWIENVTKNAEQFGKQVQHLHLHPDEISRDEMELKDGTILDRYSSPVIGQDGKHYGRIWIFRDITERKRLEARLLLSQKMETIGNLAGGIAHEFNSILTAIIGQSELLLADLPTGSPLTKNANEISKAAGRAATLTRQLLAYGRKQLLQPETLDLNRIITNMEAMLHHILGGDVNLEIMAATDLQPVKADAGQIEQVIINIAINARDAMPNGGRLMLETANVSFDLESVGRYPELQPGDYVMLAITDSGTGMTPEVKARVFEPFFSTKGVGLGSGLGLSTCYGIVKQTGGHISVYSESGRGTTFKVYLPQAKQPARNSAPRLDSPDLPRGTETILLVEDDPALREMASTLLARLGYTVLAASNGIEALNLKQQRSSGHIDLLFTDVVMPHMSGQELAERIRVSSPHTRILFTSAYTQNAIVSQGGLNKGVIVLQKPFTPSGLARKLRQVLDEPISPN
jgi:signal transduction histidine kinase/HAMP domain-containing protein